MKKIISFVLASTMTLSFASAAFSDVPESHWAYGEISVCEENGLFDGYPDGSFRPSAIITRAEAVTAVSRLYDSFKAPAGWETDGSAITREEATFLIMSGLEFESFDAYMLEAFSDRAEIAKEYEECFAKAVSNSIIFGVGNDTLRPKATLTRAEFAVLLYRAAYGEKILTERRRIAQEYMLRSTTLLWRTTNDIFYTTQSNVKPEEAKENVQFTLYADRIYHGIAYSYAGGSVNAFLDYAIGQDENGVYLIDGLTWENISGGSGIGRIGNDCSSSLLQAWAQNGATFTGTTTGYLTEAYGCLRVGNYTSVDKYEDTGAIITENGLDVIYKAYAALKPADGVVKRANNSGHCRMITNVDVVYLPDGTIDGENSMMTMIEQTVGSFKKEATYFDEKLGCDVYKVGIEQTFSFAAMAKAKYIPITCKALRNPTPIAKPTITDSETVFNKDSILSGTLTCNWMMDCATLTISDAVGKELQSATAYVSRKNEQYRRFELQEFVTSNPVLIRGEVDPSKLSAGSYNCKLTVRLITGEKVVVRDFDFEI